MSCARPGSSTAPVPVPEAGRTSSHSTPMGISTSPAPHPKTWGPDLLGHTAPLLTTCASSSGWGRGGRGRAASVGLPGAPRSKCGCPGTSQGQGRGHARPDASAVPSCTLLGWHEERGHAEAPAGRRKEARKEGVAETELEGGNRKEMVNSKHCIGSPQRRVKPTHGRLPGQGRVGAEVWACPG